MRRIKAPDRKPARSPAGLSRPKSVFQQRNFPPSAEDSEEPTTAPRRELGFSWRDIPLFEPSAPSSQTLPSAQPFQSAQPVAQLGKKKQQKRRQKAASSGASAAARANISYADDNLNRKRARALVGLELAFNDTFTRKHFSDDGFKISQDQVDIAAIGAKVQTLKDAWITQARNDAQTNGWNLTVTPEAHPQGKQHIFGNAFGDDLGRIRFAYTGLSVVAPRNDEFADERGHDSLEAAEWASARKLQPFFSNQGTWWWGLTLDPAVFELQTDPTTWQVMQGTEVRTILETSIFQAARTLGLSADRGQGGGQINIDFTTGLEGDYNKILETLNSQETMAERMSANPLAEGSSLNSPYIYQSGRVGISSADMEEAWKGLFGKYRNKIDSGTEWSEFLDEFRTLLKKYPSTEQGKSDWLTRTERFMTADTHAEDVTHFQALNVGHIENADPASRRLEFRDFKAQANLDEILGAIDLAFSFMPTLSP